jgi:predicted TIM-barrel fold metal-dependent hydrolase
MQASSGAWILDADGHVQEPAALWEDLPDEFRAYAPRVVEYPDHWRLVCFDRIGIRSEYSVPSVDVRGDETMRVQIADRVGGHDPAARLQDMDLDGIETAALFPSAALVLAAITHRGASRAFAQIINDWIATYRDHDPHRLIGIATLPAHPEDALTEAIRCVEELGFGGVWRRPEAFDGMPPLHAPEHEQLWEFLERTNTPFFVHPGYNGIVPQDYFTRRFPDFYLAGHAAHFPVEQMLALTSFICYGILDRYPRLRVGFVETGAVWALYYLHRLEEHVATWPGVTLSMRPADLFRRQCFVSVEDAEPGLAAMLALYPENIVFSSDYPHPDGTFPGSADSLLTSPALSEAQRCAVLRENALRLFGR